MKIDFNSHIVEVRKLQSLDLTQTQSFITEQKPVAWQKVDVQQKEADVQKAAKQGNLQGLQTSFLVLRAGAADDTSLCVIISIIMPV